MRLLSFVGTHANANPTQLPVAGAHMLLMLAKMDALPC